MRLIAIIGLALALISSAALAQAKDEPLQLVKSFYRKNFDEEKLPMSQRLKALHARAEAKSKELDEPVAGLDFAWTMGAQDADDGWEKTTRFAVLKADENQTTVQVRFRLFRKERIRELRYLLQRENGRWLIDDIVYVDQKGETLSHMFEMGAKGQ